MKKKLLIIFGILISVFIILLTIQTVDQKLNGEDYKKIENYSKEVASIILQENACIKDSEELFKIMFDKNYENKNINFTDDFFDKKIKSCYTLSKKIDKIEIPNVRLKNKQEHMKNFRNNTIQVLLNYTKYFQKFNECPEKNSSCLNDYDEPPISLISSNSMIISMIKMNLKYSIKDILIIRPFVLWSEYSFNKNINNYINIYSEYKE